MINVFGCHKYLINLIQNYSTGKYEAYNNIHDTIYKDIGFEDNMHSRFNKSVHNFFYSLKEFTCKLN